MKLLVYSHYFAPSIGGVETIVFALSRGLAELRTANGAPEFEITVVTETPANNFDDRSLPFRVIRQPGLFYLWRLVRECDVVHIAGPALLPLFLARLAGKPTAVEHHGYQAICPNGILVHQPERSVCPGHFQAGRYAECLHCNARETSWLRSCKNLLLMFPRHALTRQVAANVAVSQHVLRRLAMPRSTVIYHGIDDPFSNTSPPYSPHGKICFAYAGRLVQEKGITVLLRAAKKLISEGHQFEVRLIGDGDERPSLEETIGREHLESCIHITGYLTGMALADALRDVQVLVMPSNWEETAGLAAIEQMMRGRLVIVSDIGGLGEIAGDAGLRFTPGDADALADCIRKVLQNPSLMESYGRKARERALGLFTRSRMTEEHARIYRGILGHREG
ncbi:MAG: glycosyltransferase family 4 protein [Candidatus Acidiferrales bacterium]